ncbi:MAG: penicillin-binding transpeptidase domain-containing protein [Adlercreutzia equolifaciens]
MRNSEGETVVTYEPVVERTPEVTEAHLAYVRDALHGMVQESHSVGPLFEELGIDAAGKSGTGEKQDQNDTAWFVAYAPTTTRSTSWPAWWSRAAAGRIRRRRWWPRSWGRSWIAPPARPR